MIVFKIWTAFNWLVIHSIKNLKFVKVLDILDTKHAKNEIKSLLDQSRKNYFGFRKPFFNCQRILGFLSVTPA